LFNLLQTASQPTGLDRSFTGVGLPTVQALLTARNAAVQLWRAQSDIVAELLAAHGLG
jgi:hypothetical protein